jgi:hypothetical protein
MKSTRIVLMILVTLAWSLMPGTVMADDDTGKFAFYYQRIEKTVQIAPATEPTGFIGKMGALVRKGWNTVKRTFESTVRRNVVPGQGKTLWYSEVDKNLAYQMQRTKVRDEGHLLELMGVTDRDVSKLNDGQKALLALYQNAKMKSLADLSKQSLAPKIIVHLTDTTGFEGSTTYPHVTTDFWPKSMYLSITMPSKRYAYANSQADALSTFVHETAHCTNLTIPELSKPYGPDGVHYGNEIIKERMSYQEAWSNYQEALLSKEEAAVIEGRTKKLCIEDPKVAGKYTYYEATDPAITGQMLLCNESVNAMIMYKVSQSAPDGVAKVQKAFTKNNYPWRSMKGFMKTFAKLYPQDTAKLAQALDDCTARKLSGAEITAILGDTPEVRSYVRQRPLAGAAVAAIGVEAGAANDGSAEAQAQVAVESGPEIPAAYSAPAPESTDPKLRQELQSAYLEFVEAAKSAKDDLMKKAAERLKKAREALQKK